MNTSIAATDVMGGIAALGPEGRADADIIPLIRRGLPVASIEFILGSGRLTLAELDRIVLPRKTLMNRRKLGLLTPEQSDRLVRVARLIAAAEETFGSAEKAHQWLRRPTTALGGEKPLDLLDTDEGARRVDVLLGRIGHGIAA
ncbi:MAG TPA: antitoxin Xre/MbcA/ParS toxin-binding domain-containing protein [Acidisoma sp.]|jgi:putative toxin-antitoxin system antitoxin component (TIGR02293 family)|nr:antitoxin Xre/MbcA/ParS toxin-binding domain-containing protein [Acidisoma sp.]